MVDYSVESFKAGKTLFIDKDLNWTSFDVVNKVRIALRDHLGIPKIKVGHAGTLDPLATGLVILCTGKATKEIESFMGQEKEYIAEVTLGATTPSFDLETEIAQEFPVEHIEPALLEKTLDQFRGTILQHPPLFSAKQVGGKRAYSYAREGKEVKLEPREVTIHELELVSFEAPIAILRIRCSKGTYIRSLAHDLGKALNSGAHLSALRRTQIGEHHVRDAVKVEEFVKKLASL